jgi:uncharacterized protein YcbX
MKASLHARGCQEIHDQRFIGTGLLEPTRNLLDKATCIFHTQGIEVGSFVSQNRYPVKSMMAEEINSSVVTEKGLLGDRQFALMEGLARRNVVTAKAMPPGTFFDLASIHILTTATIDKLRELNPAGRFEPRRFRPNMIVFPNQGNEFVENDWIDPVLTGGVIRREDVVSIEEG